MRDEQGERARGFVLAVTGATLTLLAEWLFAAYTVAVTTGNSFAFRTPREFLLWAVTMPLLAFHVWGVIAILAAVPFLVACKIADRFAIAHLAYFLAFGVITGLLPFLVVPALISQSLSPLSFYFSLAGLAVLLCGGVLPGIVGAFVFWWKSVRPKGAR